MDIVLVNPLIPQNTGSIARSCAATGTSLHLVGKLGFEINEKRVRRAGLDYWPFVKLFQHADFEEYLARARPRKVWFFETSGSKIYYQADFHKDDALVFGCETIGLSKEFLAPFPNDQVLKIPIDCDGVRSLNLSNTVSIGLFEARRQLALSGTT